LPQGAAKTAGLNSAYLIIISAAIASNKGLRKVRSQEQKLTEVSKNNANSYENRKHISRDCIETRAEFQD
jgi:hypothetical protein